MKKDQLKIHEERTYQVWKANDLIQKSKSNLGIIELKLLAYILSKIKPTDEPGTEYFFSIAEYMKVCGLTKSGTNYENIKESLKKLHGGFWMQDESGNDTLFSWVYDATAYRSKGKFKITIDKKLSKYIYDLYGNNTQYSLIATLPMRHAYSFRIYELLKSYAYKKKVVLSIEDIKKTLMITGYEKFKDFRKKVIEVAIKEVNTYTDIRVSWEPIKEGRKTASICFYIKRVDSFGIAEMVRQNNKILDGDQIEGQTNIFDFLPDPNEPKYREVKED